MFDWILSASGLMEFATLVLLEIILGIDNIIFLSLSVNNLPTHQRAKARFLGLALAMVARIALLASIYWLSKLTKPLFVIAANEISGRDLVLILGGGFLVIKSLKELLAIIKTEPEQGEFKASGNFYIVLAEIALIDIIFSLDSVITAVGIANELSIMISAIIIAVMFMMFASAPISALVEKFVELKILALAFLVLVGAVLVLEGLDYEVHKAYIYTALGFSLVVSIINICRQRCSVKKH